MDLEEDDDEGQQPTKAPTSAEAHESLNALRSYAFASDNPVCAEEMMDLASRIDSGVETGGAGGALAPPLFCHAVSNENNMKNIEITNGFIFKKHVAFLTSRFPMILCP